MTKRRKQSSTQAPPVTQEETIPLRLRFQGEVVELIPTAAYPVHVLETVEYAEWINGIADPDTKARLSRGVFEMRLDFGPGYRVYYARRGRVVVVLLGGGDKSGQQKDIAGARQSWEGLKDEIAEI